MAFDPRNILMRRHKRIDTSIQRYSYSGVAPSGGGPPSDGLIAEDGITPLVAEDGITFLVQE